MADEGVEGTGGTATTALPPPRVVTADRRQIQLRPLDLESLLPPEHRARAIWAMVEQLALGKFYDTIVARGSEPGRPAIDPKVLVALWLYATSEGVGSAPELARVGREREKRVRQALAELPAVRAAKRTAEDKTQARVSTTDPAARVMKMSDGGFRPAYNVQLATATVGRELSGCR